MKTETSKMQVRRYIAQDMRQALKQIREELGPEAVILSNKRVPGGVEILTALDYDATTFAVSSDEASTKTSAMDAGAKHSHSIPSAASKAGHSQNQLDSAFEALLNQHLQSNPQKNLDEDLMAAMRSEIESLRFLLKDQMEQMTRENWNARNPVEAAVMQRF